MQAFWFLDGLGVQLQVLHELQSGDRRRAGGHVTHEMSARHAGGYEVHKISFREVGLSNGFRDVESERSDSGVCF
jgi:hypothetical protein